MPDAPRGVSEFVDLFLPIDPIAVDTAFTTETDLTVVAAGLGSFSAAVFHTVTPMNQAEREDFCRRVAAQSEGDIPAWMVEACLRSVEGDRDGLEGTDPAITTGVNVYGLMVLCTDYLTPNEARSIRARATEIALALLPKLEALPRE